MNNKNKIFQIIIKYELLSNNKYVIYDFIFIINLKWIYIIWTSRIKYY